ncbi:RNA polymerase, sigma 54 subunit, RpoN [Rhodothermus marinus SG0.5JP17-172]|uniref:RNA polymerase factor sigma-54 n=1 Tax=Rhodothermus marinus TaxID=29549 RepID=UPI000223DE99|nr:RNA polymerase factor sigma-54 [Rhodothermus marinus]AEN74558.1 RNA polymerase, sigma 54 subunit, RpoN [Rhodothermus marinus SG0.5JP17-172]
MLKLKQEQKLQQKLSPQQIQYIKLLQLPTLALEQRIKTELESNPLLEEGPEEEEETPLEETLDETPETAEAEATSETTETEEETAEEEASTEIEEEIDWEELFNNVDDLYGYKARVDRTDEDEERRELPLPARPSMIEHLREQLVLLDLNETERLIAEQIIGSIDEDGYLRRPLESIVDDLMFTHGVSVTEEDVERVLKQIQRLDPVGIAARDLRECLIVQLEAMPEDTPGREVALQMLREAFKDFAMKHFEALQRKLGVSEAELKEAYDLIQHLNPKPGEGGDVTPQQNYIVPDFTVTYQDGEFIITLNSRNAPQLRISRRYRQMLEQMAAEKKKGKRTNGLDEQTRAFLKNKLESARWFINSINQRRQTMLKVMKAIVELQEDFFKYGEGHLKPMILKDVADRIGMDISTVSRVVNGKYVQTDFGVYPLKYFFSEGLATESGEEVSNREVKALIQRMIEQEDKRNPLSDQKIAELLAKQGFKIARRTVTKYREQLGIPVARLRREIVLDDQQEKEAAGEK